MPLLIGWKEWAAFPAWDLPRVVVKLDTGARTAALGVDAYALDAATNTLAVTLSLDRRHPGHRHRLALPQLGTIRVRSSSGCEEVRPVVEAVLRLGSVEKVIRMTLTRRPRMRHQVLIGRLALAPEFAVDPARAFLLPRPA